MHEAYVPLMEAGILHGSSREAGGMRPTFINTDALDQLLLERFGGRVGRGLTVQLSRRRGAYTQAESLFTPDLTGYTGEDESFAETEHNAGANISL